MKKNYKFILVFFLIFFTSEVKSETFELWLQSFKNYAIKNGKHETFTEKVLKSGTKSFHGMLKNFIETTDMDPYDIYLTEALGLEFDTGDTEKTNFFDEKYETELDKTDIEDVITF